MNNYFRRLFLASIMAGLFQITNAVNDARMMRFPDINNNLVAFVYAGDI